MCKINEDASWLCLDDIDHVDKKDTVFVCEEFKGETFERLKRDNAR